VAGDRVRKLLTPKFALRRAAEIQDDQAVDPSGEVMDRGRAGASDDRH
jgi:hypothetical protein